MRPLFAELLKLRRWSVALPILACLAVAVGFLHLSADVVQVQTASQRAGAHAKRTATCAELGLPDGKRCDALRSGLVRSNRGFAAENAGLARIEESERSPLGAASLAASVTGTLVGGLMLMVLAAMHWSGEAQRRTLTVALVASGSRRRLFAAKVGSLFVAGIAMFVFTWAGIAIAGPALRAIDPLDTSISLSRAWSDAGVRIAGLPFAVLFFVGVASLCVVLLRQPVLAASLGMLCLAALNAADRLGVSTPAAWVSRVLGLDDRRYETTLHFVWANGHAGGSWLASAAALTGASLALLAGAYLAFRRVELR
jgi:hypothetical protein